MADAAGVFPSLPKLTPCRLSSVLSLVCACQKASYLLRLQIDAVEYLYSFPASQALMAMPTLSATVFICIYTLMYQCLLLVMNKFETANESDGLLLGNILSDYVIYLGLSPSAVCPDTVCTLPQHHI